MSLDYRVLLLALWLADAPSFVPCPLDASARDGLGVGKGLDLDDQLEQKRHRNRKIKKAIDRIAIIIIIIIVWLGGDQFLQE